MFIHFQRQKQRYNQNPTLQKEIIYAKNQNSELVTQNTIYRNEAKLTKSNNAKEKIKKNLVPQKMIRKILPSKIFYSFIFSNI